MAGQSAGVLSQKFAEMASSEALYNKEAADEMTVHNRAIKGVVSSDMGSGESVSKELNEEERIKKKEDKEKAFDHALDRLLDEVRENLERINEIDQRLEQIGAEKGKIEDQFKDEYGEDYLDVLAEKHGVEEIEGESPEDRERRIMEAAAADGNEKAAAWLKLDDEERALEAEKAGLEKENRNLMGGIDKNMKRLEGQLDVLNVHLVTLNHAQEEIQAIKDIDDPAARDAAFQQWKDEHGQEHDVAPDATLDEASEKIDQNVQGAKQDVAVLEQGIEEAQDKVANSGISLDAAKAKSSLQGEYTDDLLARVAKKAEVNGDEEAIIGDEIGDELSMDELPSNAPISAASEVAMGDEIGDEISFDLGEEFAVAASGKAAEEISVDAEIGNEVSLTQEITPMKLG